LGFFCFVLHKQLSFLRVAVLPNRDRAKHMNDFTN
jgi:hypothetical protein